MARRAAALAAFYARVTYRYADGRESTKHFGPYSTKPFAESQLSRSLGWKPSDVVTASGDIVEATGWEVL